MQAGNAIPLGDGGVLLYLWDLRESITENIAHPQKKTCWGEGGVSYKAPIALVMVKGEKK